MSTSFFVAADWLAEHIDDPEIQIIDARMAPAGQEALRDMAAEYRAGHVPNALFFDIEALSDHTSPLPHMMPRPKRLPSPCANWASAAISIWWFMTKAICFPRRAPGGCCAPLAWRRCRFWPVG
jgi:thiosulfate/3-mercaptopyruvate sulfurtransferase